MDRPGEFTRLTQERALARQRNVCASCGTPIMKIGDAGRADHKFGEGAHAHHIRHVKFGGTEDLNNCVIICQSCHYSVHEGGNYRHGSVMGKQSDFSYFNGKQ